MIGLPSWRVTRERGVLMDASHPVILFYKYVPIADPAAFVEAQRALCTELGLKGRILIAAEGINGTLAGPRSETSRYTAALRSDPRFSDIEIKESPGGSEAFPRLVVKVRPEIVTLGAGVELQPDHDNHLSPAEWKRTLEEEPDTVVIDVRNRYESAIGRFENAIACDIDNFRELPGYVEQLSDFKDRKVLMYCTGGIRCEKASALFRRKGFKNVFQLHGGIQTYQREFGNAHWLGECFVFDNRMTVRVEDNLRQVGKCAHTGVPTARFVNCANDDCHKLFILDEQAEHAHPEYRFCPECLAAGVDQSKLPAAAYPAAASASGGAAPPAART